MGLKDVKTMLEFIQDLLLVNCVLVLVSGVISSVISYLLRTEGFRGVEMAWDKRFGHTIYRYLSCLPIYDEHSMRCLLVNWTNSEQAID